MAKKPTGHAKTKLVRVEPLDLTDIQFLRKKVMFKKFDGDVIHELLGMFKQKEAGKYKSPLKEQDVALEDIISLYEDVKATNQSLVKVINYLCEKYKEQYAEVIQVVKHQ